MRLKLKYLLPLVQMLLAVALLVWTDRWERALMRIQDMPETPPSFGLVMAINAPLAIPRALVFRYLPGWWEDIALVAAIDVLWYWVSLNIGSWRQSHRVTMFSWIPLRLLGDMIGVGIGVMWAFVLWSGHSYSIPPLLALSDWLWFLPCVCLLILWSAVLILLFGRDFVHCLLRTKPQARPGSCQLA
jgi:hypothetical protein